MDAASDAQLVAGCRAGEQAAWEALIDRYARYVYAIAGRVYRLPPPDAEDVFQEVFARIFERLGSLRDDASLRPWIAQTARNCSIDALRRSSRESLVDELPEMVDERLAELDEALTVDAALDGLSPDCREILDRFFRRDESYHTISAALELPSGTVASRIARCLAKLRDVLEPGRKETVPPSGEKVEERR